jgi:hypothetical protein
LKGVECFDTYGGSGYSNKMGRRESSMEESSEKSHEEEYFRGNK